MYLVLQLWVFCAHFKNLGLSETPKPSTLKCSSETHTLRGSSKS